VGRRDDNKRLKREALTRAGLHLFAARGYESASIEQIVHEAGVARGTFYLYFEDKLALFDALMDAWSDVVDGVLDEVGRAVRTARSRPELLAVYQGMTLRLAAGLLAHTAEVEIAFRESRQPGEAGASVRRREQRMLGAVVAFTEIAAARGLIRAPDARLLSLVVFGAVERVVYEALTGPPFPDPAAAATEVLRLFADALGLSGPGASEAER
jgi:AcrR family transcriptional regulator